MILICCRFRAARFYSLVQNREHQMKWKQRGQVGPGVAGIVCRRTGYVCGVFVLFSEEKRGGGILRGLYGTVALWCRRLDISAKKEGQGEGWYMVEAREKTGWWSEQTLTYTINAAGTSVVSCAAGKEGGSTMEIPKREKVGLHNLPSL
ncbi:unnamed protein product [Ectocarpus fasciculatus]